VLTKRQREVVALVAQGYTNQQIADDLVLTVGTEERDGRPWAVLGVADRGPGIPPELLPRLFDRFVAGTGSGGLRLGLYLAQGIARAHGGELTVHSTPGRGARFDLAVPAEELEPSGTDAGRDGASQPGDGAASV